MAKLAPVEQLYKLVFDFRAPSGQGWSEGHYIPAGTPTGIDTVCKTLADYRLALLPPDCALVYAKYSQLGGDKDSQPLDYPYPAQGLWPGDPFVTPATEPPAGSLTIEVAEIAVFLRAIGLNGQGASRWVHGVPDNRVSSETLTAAITAATVAPPAPGAGGFSTDWNVRFGYYMYHMKALTVYGQPQRGAGGVPQWGTQGISRVIVRGIGFRRIGRPFGLRRGHASVGR